MSDTPTTGVHATVDLDAVRLHTTMAALVPLAHLAAAGGLRALPAEPRDGQTGGGDPQAFVDRLHDRGETTLARAAHRRLLLVHPTLREVLLWLADRGDARPSVRDASTLFAREHAPIALRDAAAQARTAREKAEREYALAHRRARRLLTAEVARTRDVVTQRQRDEEEALGELARWGRQRLALACAEWHAKEVGEVA